MLFTALAPNLTQICHQTTFETQALSPLLLRPSPTHSPSSSIILLLPTHTPLFLKSGTTEDTVVVIDAFQGPIYIQKIRHSPTLHHPLPLHPHSLTSPHSPTSTHSKPSLTPPQLYISIPLPPSSLPLPSLYLPPPYSQLYPLPPTHTSNSTTSAFLGMLWSKCLSLRAWYAHMTHLQPCLHCTGCPRLLIVWSTPAGQSELSSVSKCSAK